MGGVGREKGLGKNLKRRGQNRERCGVLGNAGRHRECRVPMVPLSCLRRGGAWARAVSACGVRVRLQGFGKHHMLPTERHTRLGPSPSSGHAWLETRLKCPFMAKGKNAQAEPEPEAPRPRRRGTGRGHHPAAPPVLPWGHLFQLSQLELSHSFLLEVRDSEIEPEGVGQRC